MPGNKQSFARATFTLVKFARKFIRFSLYRDTGIHEHEHNRLQTGVGLSGPANKFDKGKYADIVIPRTYAPRFAPRETFTDETFKYKFAEALCQVIVIVAAKARARYRPGQIPRASAV